MTEDQLVILLAAAQCFLAVIATLIAFYQRREQRYHTRVENLQKMNRSLQTERYEYIRESLSYYGLDAAEDDQVKQLIYRQGWMQDAGNETFLPLSSVQVNLRDGREPLWDSASNPRPRFLPKPREGYAENLKFHCEDVKLMNLPLYGLGGVHPGENGMTLDIVKGHYFDFYDTCEVLAAEMAYRRRICRKRKLSEGRLPLRDRVGDPFDFTKRFVGIGISALTILHNVQEDSGRRRSYFLLHQRSGRDVAEGANSYHVVPAGSYQPATVEFQKKVDPVDRDLNSTVIREFGEELLGKEEFSDLFNSELVSAFRQVPPAVFLGIGLDPLNTKAEVLACLTLDVETTTLFGGRQTREEIQKYFQKTYEGQVSLKELTMPMLKQFRANPRSVPAFRQILSVVLEHPGYFGVER